MNKKRILMLVRTSGLEYDDRVRKEALTLKSLGYEVFILANYISNKSEVGITDYGIPYKVVRLYSRSLIGSARFLAIKMIEFWMISTWYLIKGRYKVLWAHEEYTILSLLFKFPGTWYVFDQHELPEFLLASNFRKSLYKRIEKISDIIIVANKRRLNYMKDIGIVGLPEKYYVIHNYPDKVFADIPVKPISEHLDTWLDGSEYILMQGGGHISRYPVEVMTAIARNGKHKIVLVGPVDKAVKNIIYERFSELVFMTGYVDQLKLTEYIDYARYSIILYADHDPNNLNCEPNRLYQAVCRGIPVIVGMNPPMKDLVEQHNIGVVLSDDGKSEDGIFIAINQMEENFSIFKENVLQIKNDLNWESQEGEISKLISDNKK